MMAFLYCFLLKGVAFVETGLWCYIGGVSAVGTRN
jgi:hypothetical protein